MPTLTHLHDALLTELFDAACDARGTGSRLTPIAQPRALTQLQAAATRVLGSLAGRIVSAGRDPSNAVAMAAITLDAIAELGVYRRLN